MAIMPVRSWFTDPDVVSRSRDVARILTRHGLGAFVDHAGFGRFASRWWHARDRSISPPERLRVALSELGVTFIKLGQMASTRADLVPPEYITELAKLQDAAPRVPFQHVERTIREDFGQSLESLFQSFDREPLATASIGQVHAARLPDGTSVVVKVRRPDVIEEVERDLEILDRLTLWAQTHTRFGSDYELMPVVSEFAYTLRNELDYVREGRNAERLGNAFADDPTIWIPRVHWSHTTERVLTLDRVTGIKVTDVDRIEALKIPRRTIAQNAARMFLREVLELGFFHADPHPGNFFVQPDGAIAVVDFGMVGRVSEGVRDHLLRGGFAMLDQDPESLAEELFALGVAGRNADKVAFIHDLDHLMSRYHGRSIRELSAAAVTRELSEIAFRHRLQLPGELALLLRVVSMSEGLGLMLDPGFQYFEFASPIFRKHWEASRSPAAGVVRLGRAAAEAAELGLGFPRRAGRLLGRLERGELELNVRHEGLTKFAQELQGMTNRLALAMILAASVVALGVALGFRRSDGLASHLWLLFALGFLFSLVFGVWVVGSIWRSRRR